jgi:glycosyltransferase involved in cell wall biosynthesis
MIVAFGRLLGFGFNIHYHTYRSINRHSKLMALFTTLCGDHAVHIALASSMASALRRRYPAIKRIAAVSNAAFLPLPPAASSSKQREFCIGHLSNLSSAKGTDKVIDCFRALRSSGVQIDLLLAGPVSDSGTQKVLNDAIADLGEHVTYLGPVKRSELQDFYGRIDAFLFPSAYEHEAEPLVAIEALSFGVPVLATNRGCIEALLGADGLVFGQDEFVAEATRQITTWARSPDSLAAASERARGRFLEVKRDAQDALNTLLARMCTP